MTQAINTIFRVPKRYPLRGKIQYGQGKIQYGAGVTKPPKQGYLGKRGVLYSNTMSSCLCLPRELLDVSFYKYNTNVATMFTRNMRPHFEIEPVHVFNICTTQ